MDQRFEVRDKLFQTRDWIIETVAAILLFTSVIAALGFAHNYAPAKPGKPRCFRTFGSAQWPKWIERLHAKGYGAKWGRARERLRYAELHHQPGPEPGLYGPGR
jgi:hypothetical protein